jgi:hypothetical protein
MAFLGLDTNKTDEVFCTLDTMADIPLDDQSAWDMYSKYRWVYSTSRLLDLQNVPWSIYYGAPFTAALYEFQGVKDSILRHKNDPDPQTRAGMIFVDRSKVVGEELTTDAVILKGELKWLAHHVNNVQDQDGKICIGMKVLDEINGGVELRIAAFAKMALSKFTGVISVDTVGNTIVGVRLHMTPEVISQYPENWMQNVVKLYNRKQWPKL